MTGDSLTPNDIKNGKKLYHCEFPMGINNLEICETDLLVRFTFFTVNFGSILLFVIALYNIYK